MKLLDAQLVAEHPQMMIYDALIGFYTVPESALIYLVDHELTWNYTHAFCMAHRRAWTPISLDDLYHYFLLFETHRLSKDRVRHLMYRMQGDEELHPENPCPPLNVITARPPDPPLYSFTEKMLQIFPSLEYAKISQTSAVASLSGTLRHVPKVTEMKVRLVTKEDVIWTP